MKYHKFKFDKSPRSKIVTIYARREGVLRKPPIKGVTLSRGGWGSKAINTKSLNMIFFYSVPIREGFRKKQFPNWRGSHPIPYLFLLFLKNLEDFRVFFL